MLTIISSPKAHNIKVIYNDAYDLKPKYTKQVKKVQDYLNVAF